MIAWKFIIQKHTKAAIEGIPPKKINTGNIWKQIYYMQASDKDKCNTIQNRKTKNMYGRKQKWKDSVSGTRTKR